MKRAAAALIFILLSGCAGDASMPPLAADHPANPAAPTAPLARSTTLVTTAPAPATAPATQPGAGGGVVYVCPMHAEVTSSDPDARCPICHMYLEPKKGAVR